MINFPRVSPDADVPFRKMDLYQYSVFSEKCLKGNASITPQNCLEKRALEKTITKPFSLDK